ncbi:hypothetical protein ON010_g2411 [Phytophthora cinnamomi]|nr:hypothetical protein ON010_g2411 [Phytophthora cinnamomi]
MSVPPQLHNEGGGTGRRRRDAQGVCGGSGRGSDRVNPRQLCGVDVCQPDGGLHGPEAARARAAARQVTLPSTSAKVTHRRYTRGTHMGTLTGYGHLRHVSRGYCVNWNVESELWTHLFTSTEMLKVDPSEHALVVTAPLLAPTVVNESMDQVVFEELGFQAYARVSAAESCVLSYSEFSEREFQESLKKPVKRSPGRKKREKGKTDPPTPPPVVDEDPLRFSTSSCHLVVDSGFSFTHVVPVIDRKVYLPGVRRINVGGKLLTNYLKEIVSYRQWNVMDDTPVINELKEALCYCSLDFDNDLKRYHSDRQERKHWILPDFVRRFEGRCREDEEEAVTEEEEEEEEAAEEEASADQQQPTRPTDDEQALMGVEMITVPEVLFNPSDIGLNQAGIAETIVQAVEACPEELSDAFYANILLVGGNTKFKNFKRRLERDLRSLVPDDYDIELNEPSEIKKHLVSSINQESIELIPSNIGLSIAPVATATTRLTSFTRKLSFIVVAGAVSCSVVGLGGTATCADRGPSDPSVSIEIQLC